MKEQLNYYRQKHQQTGLCWLVINIVLTLAYFLEYFKGVRTMSYIITFLFVTWTPLVAYLAMYRKYRNEIKADRFLEYTVGYGYLIFYTFCVITANTKMVFCYILPMLCVLTYFFNRTLTLRVMFGAIAVNCLKAAYDFGSNTAFTINDFELTDYEIVFACLILCAFFAERGCTLLQLREKMIAQLSEEVYYDALTKIHCRIFIPHVEQRWVEKSKHIKSLAIVDIDDFKSINDKYGHKTGDAALIKLAELLTSVTKESKSTYPVRLGGDEFVIISSTLTALEIKAICEELKDKLTRDFTYSEELNEHFTFTLSIGIIEGTAGCTFDSLYSPCDKLLYEAKATGKNNIKVKYD